MRLHDKPLQHQHLDVCMRNNDTEKSYGKLTQTRPATALLLVDTTGPLTHLSFSVTNLDKSV